MGLKGVELIIEDKEYPVAEGRIAKEAKQNAAKLAWFALQEQSDWDSKLSVRSTVSEGGAPPVLSTPSTPLGSYEASSQRTSTSTSPSITLEDSTNPSQAQMPLESESDTPTRLSNSLESISSSQSMSTGTSGSGIFTDSSNSSKDQHPVKDKIIGNTENQTSTLSRFTDEFDVTECLGKGAYGCVHAARDKLLKQGFAVKIVRSNDKALREVGTLSKLLHCNIVRYYTCWMEDSRYQGHITAGNSAGSFSSSQSIEDPSAKYLYIQMELCKTKTLKKWINEKNTQSLQDSKRRQESVAIAQQIVCGVEYIHSMGHIHRDLKPENILFGVDEKVKIGDFGMVTKDDDDDDDTALMERSGLRGTSTYMAPEQITGKTYDRKVDIFALGLIYFELLWKLSTGHERGVVWNDARSQKLPEEFSLTFAKETEKAAKVPQKTATKVLGVLNENVLKDRVNIKAGQSTRQEPHDAPHIEKALSEVKTLIKLLHDNIVRYFTCWLEDSGYSPDESGSSTQYATIRYPIRYVFEPANIMIGQDGQLKIVDFGMVTYDNDAENLRKRLMYKGTPSYMAPEQVLTDLREQTFPKEFSTQFLP
ncbi:hypothetical protein KUCAC02_023902 [Chaenocephalus aceratus]|uniref:Uncharacterized protein n=1 Tax=Chaenocephalus aceratus TaxID=36190 RepID=A0ACB9WHU4_CHAAC|nr:hypothetical protein KUCAC02_023902 [Chaenocephalus aceratus]